MQGRYGSTAAGERKPVYQTETQISIASLLAQLAEPELSIPDQVSVGFESSATDAVSPVLAVTACV